MYRATVFAIVLTLATGPSISAFCKAWCNQYAAAKSDCHHDGADARASVYASGDCQDETLSGLAAVKEEVRRTGSPDHAVLVPPSAAGESKTMGSVGPPRALAPPTHNRPLSAPLRI